MIARYVRRSFNIRSNLVRFPGFQSILVFPTLACLPSIDQVPLDQLRLAWHFKQKNSSLYKHTGSLWEMVNDYRIYSCISRKILGRIRQIFFQFDLYTSRKIESGTLGRIQKAKSQKTGRPNFIDHQAEPVLVYCTFKLFPLWKYKRIKE